MLTEYFIQEKSFGKATTLVKDQDGRPLFTLVGRSGTKGDWLTLYRMNGENIASVKQVSWAFMRRFEIYEGEQKVGTLQRFLNWPSDFYFVQQLHWVVYGNLAQHQYKIQYFNHEVMSMDKTQLLSGGYYRLQVTKEKDAPICICLAAILDYWNYHYNRGSLLYHKETLELRSTYQTFSKK